MKNEIKINFDEDTINLIKKNNRQSSLLNTLTTIVLIFLIISIALTQHKVEVDKKLTKAYKENTIATNENTIAYEKQNESYKTLINILKGNDEH